MKNNFVVVAIAYPIRIGRVVGVFEDQLVAEICAHALTSLKTNVWYAGPKNIIHVSVPINAPGDLERWARLEEVSLVNQVEDV